MATVRYDKRRARFLVVLSPHEINTLEKQLVGLDSSYTIDLLLKEAVTKRWAAAVILNFAYARSYKRLPSSANLAYGADLALYQRGYTFKRRGFRWERQHTPIFAPPDTP